MIALERHTTSWKDIIPTETQLISRVGILSVGGFILLFVLWSIFIPLSGAVVANGSIISAGQNKLIQHPAGGTVVAIYAFDGQSVQAGEPIITLDPIVDQAELDRLRGQRFLARAIEARLLAQLSGKSTIRFPPEFDISNSLGLRGRIGTVPVKRYLLARLVQGQKDEFTAAQKRLDQEIAGLQQQSEALKEKNRGLRARLESLSAQVEILENQVQRIRPLVAEGYVARNRANEVERQLLEIIGDVADTSGEIASTKHRIAEIQNRIAQTQAASQEKISEELTRARAEIVTYDNQIKAAENIVDRREIIAPVSGTITNSKIHTIGGVVRPGDIVAEVVPASEGLVVEARIMPQDIDYVRNGQTAEIVITAFNRRLYDPIQTIVDYVAADAQIDERTGESYFVVRLKLSGTSSNDNRISDLRAGMQSEVYISTEKRSFLNYLLKPVSDSFRRAFREQ